MSTVVDSYRFAVAGGGSAYADEVLADSPIGYWRLEETSGTTVNDETGTYDGTLSGPTLGRTGGVDNAYLFDGSNDYITTTTLGTYGANIPESTIEFWIKTTASSTVFAGGTVNTGTNLFLSIILNGNDLSTDGTGGSGITSVFIRGQGGSTLSKVNMTSNIYDGAWHHCAVTIGASPIASGQWYVDGSTVTTTTPQTGANSFANFDFAIGWGARNVRGTIGGFASCELDEIAVYDTVLTGARISAHYNAA